MKLKSLKLREFPTCVIFEMVSGRSSHCSVPVTLKEVDDVNSHLFPQTGKSGKVRDVAFRRSSWVILRQIPKLSCLINIGADYTIIRRCLGDTVVLRGIESPAN